MADLGPDSLSPHSSCGSIFTKPKRVPYIPEDVLLEIVQYLTTDKSTIKNLCSASHGFRILFESTLYKHIELDTDFNRSIFLLLRAILSRPLLALHIKDFQIGADKPASVAKFVPTEQFKPRFNKREEQQLVQLMKESNIFDSPEDGRRAILSGSIDAAVALILAKCHNLQGLHLRVETALIHPHPQRKSGTAIRSYVELGLKFTSAALSLQSLRTADVALSRTISSFENLKIVSLYSYPKFRLDQAIPLFFLPNIEQLSIFGGFLDGFLGDDELREDDSTIHWDPSRPSSPIIRLRIYNDTISWTDLEDILQACPHLQNLELAFGGCIGLDFSKLNKALSHVNASLCSFSLLTNIYTAPALEPEEGEEEEEGYQGVVDLSKFSRLEALVIPIQFLIERDHGQQISTLYHWLPSGIKTIRFVMNLYNRWLEFYAPKNTYIASYINEIMEARQQEDSDVPRLEQITILWEFKPGEDYSDSELQSCSSDVVDACTRAGIECIVEIEY